jgi:hypothetical protein
MSKVMHAALRSRKPRALGFTGLMLACSLLGGCTRAQLGREGRVSQDQADDYLRAAIRQSSEGVVLDPSQEGLDQIERVRLGEIAQELRGPAAVCFLERAIQTMEAGTIDDEAGWLAVPEGQIKLRARVAVDGTVLTTDVLESGFTDDHMETCVGEVIRTQRFVESRDSFAYFIDVYYWVSLGMFAEAGSESFAEVMRRQCAEAGVRAKACLTGRVPAGEYVVTGLNLFDRDGRTVVNRIDRGELPSEVSSCIATAFKQVHIHSEPDAFVRPGAPKATFTVTNEGVVSMADERWLAMTELEEQAQREMRRAELLEQTGQAPEGVDAEVPDGWTDLDVDPIMPDGPIMPVDEPRELSIPAPIDEGPQPQPPPTGDPTKPGTKLDLSPRSKR